MTAQQTDGEKKYCCYCKYARQGGYADYVAWLCAHPALQIQRETLRLGRWKEMPKTEKMRKDEIECGPDGIRFASNRRSRFIKWLAT